MHTPPLSKTRHADASRQHLLGAAVMWLVAGSFLLITTLVPVYSQTLGWTSAFWLVGAPLIVLLTLEPSLPRQLLARRRPRQTSRQAAMWH
jgi:cytochrome c biogenesis factor